MPYVYDNRFKLIDDTTKIWRYMDFAKFLSMLDNNSLFFSTLKALAAKYDSFEGYYPAKELAANIENYPYPYNNVRMDMIKKTDVLYSSWNDSILVNCWHMNESESDAMWKIYSLRGQGIAIQSSFSKLCKSFSDFEDVINIIPVEYVDYNTVPKEDINDIFWIPTHKRGVFSHENELRAVYLNKKVYSDQIQPIKVIEGQHIPIKINELIEKIYLSPNSRKWYKELIEKILKKYNINAQIVTSELDRQP